MKTVMQQTHLKVIILSCNITFLRILTLRQQIHCSDPQRTHMPWGRGLSQEQRLILANNLIIRVCAKDAVNGIL